MRKDAGRNAADAACRDGSCDHGTESLVNPLRLQQAPGREGNHQYREEGHSGYD